MTKDIQLYDYQKDMVKRIEEAFESHQSVMVQMPTGTGKTHVLVEVVKNEEQRVKNPCVWIIAHRRELVSQIEDTVRTFGIEPYSEKHTDSKIRVRSIQWLTRHYNVCLLYTSCTLYFKSTEYLGDLSIGEKDYPCDFARSMFQEDYRVNEDIDDEMSENIQSLVLMAFDAEMEQFISTLEEKDPFMRVVSILEHYFLLSLIHILCVGAEKQGTGVYSYKGDARITKVGKIIRATSIDELPQLVNILKGDMALIGPRPALDVYKRQVVVDIISKRVIG